MALYRCGGGSSKPIEFELDIYGNTYQSQQIRIGTSGKKTMMLNVGTGVTTSSYLTVKGWSDEGTTIIAEITERGTNTFDISQYHTIVLITTATRDTNYLVGCVIS